MSVMKPKDLGKFIKGKKNPLVVTGALCDEIDFPEAKKNLLDYAVDMHKKLKEKPIAACANTVVGLKQKGVTATKKMWVGEVLEYTRDPWMEPMIKDRPDALVFLGYTPQSMGWLCGMAKDIDTVALGYRAVDQATYSLPDTTSFTEFRKNLEELVKAL
ncbi:MAG: hypothetical protein HYX90_04765 [Chloroflexi bacterium]|nr:hypothetical protein [Chloroflexota bacterium]